MYGFTVEVPINALRLSRNIISGSFVLETLGGCVSSVRQSDSDSLLIETDVTQHDEAEEFTLQLKPLK